MSSTLHPPKPGVSGTPVSFPISRDRQPGANLTDEYEQVRGTTEAICSPLTADDQMVQSTPEASPAKWHQAHTTWFFETFLLTAHAPDYRPFDPAFRSLFNSYYKQLGTHPLRSLRSTFSRPTLQEVLAYRRYVDEHMLRWLRSGDAERSDIHALVELGLNHEQQHQELILTDVKHGLWSNPLQPTYLSRPVNESLTQPERIRWKEFPGGLCEIGHAGPGFSFDNESPVHQEFLQPYRLASRLVSNGDYLEFMQDGGYRRPELWLSDGWDTVLAAQWDAPLYWELEDGDWTVFTLMGRRRLRLEEPVCHISYYEADAFARWAGARLPREAEWEIAARDLSAKGNLLETGRYHPMPPEQASSAGDAAPQHAKTGRVGDPIAPAQMFGDVWEWTASPYVGYPGFRPAAGLTGEYNGKFMCNQLVLRGGSCLTPQSHIRASYRNFFAPQMRWQFMGIRLAHDHS